MAQPPARVGTPVPDRNSFYPVSGTPLPSAGVRAAAAAAAIPVSVVSSRSLDEIIAHVQTLSIEERARVVRAIVPAGFQVISPVIVVTVNRLLVNFLADGLYGIQRNALFLSVFLLERFASQDCVSGVFAQDLLAAELTKMPLLLTEIESEANYLATLFNNLKDQVEILRENPHFLSLEDPTVKAGIEKTTLISLVLFGLWFSADHPFRPIVDRVIQAEIERRGLTYSAQNLWPLCEQLLPGERQRYLETCWAALIEMSWMEDAALMRLAPRQNPLEFTDDDVRESCNGEVKLMETKKRHLQNMAYLVMELMKRDPASCQLEIKNATTLLYLAVVVHRVSVPPSTNWCRWIQAQLNDRFQVQCQVENREAVCELLRRNR